MFIIGQGSIPKEIYIQAGFVLAALIGWNMREGKGQKAFAAMLSLGAAALNVFFAYELFQTNAPPSFVLFTYCICAVLCAVAAVLGLFKPKIALIAAVVLATAMVTYIALFFLLLGLIGAVLSTVWVLIKRLFKR